MPGILLLALSPACHLGEPAAGELRTDLDGLAARVVLPEDVREVRWMTQAARVGKTGTGRADARVFAWITTPSDETEWLTTTLGSPLGPRVHWVHDEVADVLFTEAERAAMQRNKPRETWKLGCVRYPAVSLGRGEYRGDVALDCSGHLYVALTAH